MGYNRNIVKIDSIIAKNIGFTSEFFYNGTVFNKLPYGYYITRLEPKNDKAIPQMLKKIKEHGFLVRIDKFRLGLENCNECIEKAGYEAYKHACGTIEYLNYKIKINENGKKTIIKLDTLDKIV